MKHFASQSQVKQLIKAGYDLKPHYDLGDLIELAGKDLYGLFPPNDGRRSWEADDCTVGHFHAANPIDAMFKLLINNPKK